MSFINYMGNHEAEINVDDLNKYLENDEFGISPYHMYADHPGLIYDSKDEGTLAFSVPVLAMTGKVFTEINYITNTYSDNEYAVFMLLKRIDQHKPHYLAFDWFMPKQSVSTAGVNIDSQDSQKYFDILKELDYYKKNGLQRHMCHLHSHGKLDCFWSATDNEQQLSKNDLGFMDDYRIYAVVSAKGNIKCSFVAYKPILFRKDCRVSISYSEPEYIGMLTSERKKEIDLIVKENRQVAIAPAPVHSAFSAFGLGTPYNYGGYIKGNSYIKDEDLNNFAFKDYQQLTKSDVLCRIDEFVVPPNVKVYVDKFLPRLAGVAESVAAWCISILYNLNAPLSVDSIFNLVNCFYDALGILDGKPSKLKPQDVDILSSTPDVDEFLSELQEIVVDYYYQTTYGK